jgi:hypothetical protein
LRGRLSDGRSREFANLFQNAEPATSALLAVTVVVEPVRAPFGVKAMSIEIKAISPMVTA